MKGRLVCATLALLFGLPQMIAAQTFPHLTVRVEGRTINAAGGEKPNTSFSSGPLVIGHTTSSGFAKMPDFCGFAVAARLTPGGVSGWTVSVTPTKVENNAVTFRVRWVRARDGGRGTTAPSGDMEVTMRPGQSMPLDIVPLSPDVTMPSERCLATSLHVGVEYWPPSEQDRRLVATELWLIERLADGSERAQALSLRGLPSRETPFFFDTMTDASTQFDLYGDIAVAPAQDHPDELLVTIRARGRVTQGGRSSTSIPDGGLMGSRSVGSQIRLRAGEIVDVPLPRLTENSNGAFANHAFSLRIRSRQIR